MLNYIDETFMNPYFDPSQIDLEGADPFDSDLIPPKGKPGDPVQLVDEKFVEEEPFYSKLDPVALQDPYQGDQAEPEFALDPEQQKRIAVNTAFDAQVQAIRASTQRQQQRESEITEERTISAKQRRRKEAIARFEVEEERQSTEERQAPLNAESRAMSPFNQLFDG